MHGFLSLKVCTVSDILKRNLVECILPRVGVFGANGDGKVEQRENDTHHTAVTCVSFPLGEAGGQRGLGLAKVWMTNYGTFRPRTISRLTETELSLPVKWGRPPAAPPLHVAPSQDQSRLCEVSGK